MSHSRKRGSRFGGSVNQNTDDRLSIDFSVGNDQAGIQNAHRRRSMHTASRKKTANIRNAETEF